MKQMVKNKTVKSAEWKNPFLYLFPATNLPQAAAAFSFLYDLLETFYVFTYLHIIRYPYKVNFLKQR